MRHVKKNLTRVFNGRKAIRPILLLLLQEAVGSIAVGVNNIFLV
jgi:hypothetical protein